MGGQPRGEVGALDSFPKPSERIEVLHLVAPERTLCLVGGEERGCVLWPSQVHHCGGHVLQDRTALRPGPVDRAGDSGAVVVKELLG